MRIGSLFLLTIFLVSCGVANNPKDVAEYFIHASLKMDFKEAKKYATPETEKMLDFVQNITSRTIRDSSLYKDIRIQMGEVTINGDHSIVKYRKDGSKDEYALSLVKINGKWLVAAGIDDPKAGNELKAGEKTEWMDSTSAN